MQPLTPETYGYALALKTLTRSEIDFVDTLLGEIALDMQIDGVKEYLRARRAMQKSFIADLEKQLEADRTNAEPQGEGE